MARLGGLLSFLPGMFGFGERRPTVKPTETAGVGGAVSYGGMLVSPEKDSRLQGLERYRTFSEILANNDIVAAGVRHFLNLIGKALWRYEPASDPRGPEIAELVHSAFVSAETGWPRIVKRAAMYRFYGFSIQEWTARRREDGGFDLLDVEPRPQSTIEQWDLDETSKVLGVGQRSPQTGEVLYIPRQKLVYAVDDALNDNPEGLGLFRHVAESARILERYQQLEGFGFETDLRGIPIGRAPLAELESIARSQNLSAGDKAKLTKPLTDFLENHIRGPKLALMLDSQPYRGEDAAASPSATKQWDVELLKAGGTSLPEIAAAIERLHRQIARVLGVEGLLLGERGTGSLALSKDKSHNFALTVQSTLQELAEFFRKDLVLPLLRLNGIDSRLAPTLKTEAVQLRDVSEITQVLRDAALAGAPLDPDDPAIPEIRDLLGVSRPRPIVLRGAEEDSSRGVGNRVGSATGLEEEPAANGGASEGTS